MAWWLWALGMATAASRTTNPLLLGLLLAVVGYVVVVRRGDAPWARSFKAYLVLGLVVIAIRVLFNAVLGAGVDGDVLFTLPQVGLPAWARGIDLGGPVTAQEVLGAAYDGLRLATLLCCVGAANALANPKRALRSLPPALYEVGVAVVVALTVAPQLVESVLRVRRARRLRGAQAKGLRALRALAVPVLEDALSRSLLLAAAMDSRGYGRSRHVPAALRRVTGALVLTGLLGVCLGLYGLLDPTTPPALGYASLAVRGRSVRGGVGDRRTARRAQPLPPGPLAAPRAAGRRERCGVRAGRGRCEQLRPAAPAPLPLPAALARPAARAAAGCPRRPGPRGVRATAGARCGAAAPGGSGVISFEAVSITYPGAVAPTLRDVDLVVPEGELCIAIGATGAGKSTLLGAVNGLVPHFTGGSLRGRVLVDGRDTRTHPPRELADLVGVVGQDPLAGFVTDTLEEELAYGMEQLGLPADVMRKRVEEVLDLLGLADVRDRALTALSGGQQQRAAIGAVLTTHPRVLVLDEPTSALDPTAAEEVLAAVTRLVHDLGVTVLMAEHRLERVLQYADRVIHLPGDGTVRSGPPELMMSGPVPAPPVVELGRLAGWEPLPLSVRDARRLAGPLRAQLPAVPVAIRAQQPVVLAARRVVVRYGDVIAVREVDLDLHSGGVCALMGRNGAGKSSLLWALQGAGPRTSGSVLVAGSDPGALAPSAARSLVGLVPQTAADLLYLDTVAAELAQADRESGQSAGTADALLTELLPDVDRTTHPRDLSEGQRLGLVLAIQLTAAPSVLLLDEPTRGLDYAAKHRLTEVLRRQAEAGRSVVVSTHDVEFVAATCDRVVVMAQGEVVADGPTAEVVLASPTFAPQVAKVLAPLAWLTVAEVAAGLSLPRPA